MKFLSRYATASLMAASAKRNGKGKCLPTIHEEGEDLSSDDVVKGETVAKGENLSSDDVVKGETVAKGEDLSSDDEGLSSDDVVKGEVKGRGSQTGSDAASSASGFADVVTTTSDLMARAASGRLMFDNGRGEVPPGHVAVAWSSHTLGTVRVAEPPALLRYAVQYTRTQHPRRIVHREDWGPYHQRRIGGP